MPETLPYGSWPSPITAATLVEQVVGLSQAQTFGDDVLWNESRPGEGGRMAVVLQRPDGRLIDVLPAGASARTLVHEYGGQSFCVAGESVVFTSFADQRLWSVRLGEGGVGEPVALTPEPPSPRAWRYADQSSSPDRRWVVAVRERHGDEVVNDIVAVALDDGGADPVTIAEGHDFYSAPRFSPDGSQLAWLSWDHPNMPWDGTELWVASVSTGMEVGEPRLVAGGAEESVTQPRWSPDGTLHFISDRTGWWNVYADDGGSGVALAPRAAEFSGPDWVFGQSTYCFLPDGRLVCSWSQGGRARLGVLADGELQEVDQPFTALGSIVPTATGTSVIVIGASPVRSSVVARIDVDSSEVTVLKRSRETEIDERFTSVPDAIEFPTEGGLTAHAYFYAPHNPDATGFANERPPLVVMSHGGPTSATSSVLNPSIQFWTTRGVAVVDVNYGGSTGYGREYRQRLRDSWGIVDVDDCVNAATWLAKEGRVDGERMVIRGGSAGGYTTLAALTFRDVFAAGASLFGVADAEALARDTHKFESRYLDGLIGPYPEAAEVYRQRSPIHFTEQLTCPLIVFQGLEDKVVPPEQSEMIVEALQGAGVPVAYLAYEGEQHGFRKAENIVRTAEAELWFYGRVLGFHPADEIEPVEIHNADALTRR